MGSMGDYNQIETSADSVVRGGGHIHINVDHIILSGKESHIQANGDPDKHKNDQGDKNGGSGGYIYIKTSNEKKPNTFDE